MLSTNKYSAGTYTIAEYDKRFIVLGNNLRARIADAQHRFAEMICEEVRENAPVDTGQYQNSIVVSPTGWQGNTCITRVYSDLLVGGDNEKWAKVPLGVFLEYGTGLKGEATNTQEHGFPYRQTAWTYYNERYDQWITTTGMIARPHFLPPMLLHRKEYTREMRRAVYGL